MERRPFDTDPMALIDLVRGVHEKEGVVLHLGRTVSMIEKDAVLLDDGARLPADLVVAGIGVKPREELAQSAGLRVEKGIVVGT